MTAGYEMAALGPRGRERAPLKLLDEHLLFVKKGCCERREILYVGSKACRQIHT